jgi:hypothetical protein
MQHLAVLLDKGEAAPADPQARGSPAVEFSSTRPSVVKDHAGRAIADLCSGDADGDQAERLNSGKSCGPLTAYGTTARAAVASYLKQRI